MRRGQYQHLSGDGSVQPGQFDTKRDKQLLKFIIITTVQLKGQFLLILKELLLGTTAIFHALRQWFSKWRARNNCRGPKKYLSEADISISVL